MEQLVTVRHGKLEKKKKYCRKWDSGLSFPTVAFLSSSQVIHYIMWHDRSVNVFYCVPETNQFTTMTIIGNLHLNNLELTHYTIRVYIHHETIHTTMYYRHFKVLKKIFSDAI